MKMDAMEYLRNELNHAKEELDSQKLQIIGVMNERDQTHAEMTSTLQTLNVRNQAECDAWKERYEILRLELEKVVEFKGVKVSSGPGW